MMLSPKHIIVEDMFASISYQLQPATMAWAHQMILTIWANRRIRSVGELLQNQLQGWPFPTGKSGAGAYDDTGSGTRNCLQALINITPCNGSN